MLIDGEYIEAGIDYFYKTPNVLTKDMFEIVTHCGRKVELI